jgi:DNA helicase HerA-like ATPase
MQLTIGHALTQRGTIPFSIDLDRGQFRHGWLLGKSGTGKSTLLRNIMRRCVGMERVTAQEAGKSLRIKTKDMDKTYKIEPRQREALAEMLRDAKNRRSSELEHRKRAF